MAEDALVLGIYKMEIVIHRDIFALTNCRVVVPCRSANLSQPLVGESQRCWHEYCCVSEREEQSERDEPGERKEQRAKIAHLTKRGWSGMITT